MFVVIFDHRQIVSTASEVEDLIRSEYIDAYKVRSNGSQRQLSIETVAGNTWHVIEPACQTLCLDLLKNKQHK